MVSFPSSLVFEASIPTCTCFHSENFLWLFYYTLHHGSTWLYLNLLHSTMALLDSTWISIMALFSTLGNSGQAPMGTRSSSAKNWGWVVTRRKSLVSCQGYQIDSLRLCFVEASSTVEKAVSCLQSRPTCSPIAKFPQHSVIACSTQILCCRERMLRTRQWMGVCKPLMPDVMVPKMHQKNCSYVSSADLPSDSLCKNFAWWEVIHDPQQKQIGYTPVAVKLWLWEFYFGSW